MWKITKENEDWTIIKNNEQKVLTVAHFEDGHFCGDIALSYDDLAIDNEPLQRLKKNILALDWAMDDAQYHGFTGENIHGVRFAIGKILDGTGISIKSLHKERQEKKWLEL